MGIKLKSLNKTIEVKIDPLLSPSLQAHSSPYSSCNNHKIKINLYDLMLSIGTIQSCRPNKKNLTNKIKLMDFDFLKEWIQSDEDFKIVSGPYDPEALSKVSEHLGIGIAVETTHVLYGIKRQTLGKIIRRGRKKTPDFECHTKLDKHTVVESKGTTNHHTRKAQKIEALEQKISLSADLHIASCTQFSSSDIASCEYLDPPLISPRNPEYKKRLLMADHYVRIFNLIGQKELAEYFSLMKKRIKKDKEFPQYMFKEHLFRKIKDESLKIRFNSKVYLGRVDQISRDKYIFTGLDRELLSAHGFLHFEDNAEPLTISLGNNDLQVSTDGICIGKIDDLNSLPFYLKKEIIKGIKKGSVKNYQGYTTLVDIDLMSGYAFEKYIRYLLRKEAISFITGDNQFGLVATHRGKKIHIKIKLAQKNLHNKNIHKSKSINIKTEKILLITNLIFSIRARRFLSKEKNIHVIDRPLLRRIVHNSQHLKNFFDEITLNFKNTK